MAVQKILTAPVEAKQVELTEDMKKIQAYTGENSFVKEIQSKLEKYGKLSDKQVSAALGQIQKEDESFASLNKNMVDQPTQKISNKLIVDTDMYVMKVWCEYVFNNCHHYILEQINQRSYDLYLLCDIDLPWASDEMREYPDAGPRLELFTIYKELLINQNTPWGIVSGTGAQRTTNAIQLIDQHL